MFTIQHGLGGHAVHRGWHPAKPVRLAALLGTLIVTSVTINGLIIHADSTLRQWSNTSNDCSAIIEASDRLACYDRLALQPVSQPAKGANAPARFHAQ